MTTTTRSRREHVATSALVVALCALSAYTAPAYSMRRSPRLTGAPVAAAPRAAALGGTAAGKKGSGAKRAAAAPTAAKAAAPKAAKTAEAPLAHASLAREQSAWADGVRLVIGCDEAGRGPLAGPVVAAACSLPASAAPIAGVGDSKTITDEAMRESLYEQIVGTPGVRWSARVVSASRIDDINILMASLEAMRYSIVDVLHASSEARALALIDGPFSPWKEGEKYAAFQLPAPPAAVGLEVEPIKGGDGKVCEPDLT